MSRKREFMAIGTLIMPLLTLLLLSTAWAAPRATSATGKEPLAKPTIISHEHFDGNTIDCTITNDGLIVDQRVSGASGMEWPKGTGKTIDYASGLWLAGIGHDDSMIRTACVEYSSELVPGNWGQNQQEERFRIYKINKDGTGDWDVWPADQGAPVDSLGNPLLLGDQTLFFVCNDGYAPQHANVFSTPPMDVEFRVTIFGYDHADPLGNIMFVKWEFINRGTQQFDSCFVALWDDPDLGDASDDLVGCDTTLGLGYCYNGFPTDSHYGSTPPALGFDFFQGPEVPWGSGNYLGMTAFAWYYNGAPDPFDDPGIASEAYWFMNGYAGDGTPYTDHLGNPTRFPFYGDPVSGTGHLDGEVTSPGDRRFLMSSGPFNLAPGDTQVVVGAKVIAQGTNRLNSVTALRSFDNYAQMAYDNYFVDLPKDWIVNVSYPNPSQAELQIQVGLENVSQVSADFCDHHDVFITSVQLFDDGLHDDQDPDDGIWGNSIITDCHCKALYMNVHDVHPVYGDRNWNQLETNITVAGPVTVADMYVGMDHINSDGLVNPGEAIRYTVGVENETNFDLQSVTIEPYHVLEGSYFQEFMAPKGNKILPTLNAGQTLTWAYDPDSVYYHFRLSPDTPANDSVHVVFRLTDDDFNLWQDTLAIFVAPIQYIPQYSQMELVSGITDGRFEYMIVNPTLLTGHTYRLYLHEYMDTLTYDLKDHTTGATLLYNQKFPDIYGLNSQEVDGFRVMQGTAENIARGFDWDWTDTRWLSWVNWGGSLFGGAIGLGKEFFGSTLREWEYKDVRIDFDPSGVTTTNCKVYRRDLGYAVQPGLGTFNGAAYDIFNPANPRRLNIVLVEYDTPEKPADMIWNPDNSGIGGREYLFIMNSDYDAVTAGGYDDDNCGISADVLFYAWTRLRPGYTFLENPAEFTLYVNPGLVRDGDVFEFTPIWTGVEHEDLSLPKDFSLRQNYPNPFNPVTTIQYSVPILGQVELIIYNILGQRIAKLVDRMHKPGVYYVKWDGSQYASGVYFCRFQAGEYVETKKMVLLR